MNFLDDLQVIAAALRRRHYEMAASPLQHAFRNNGLRTKIPKPMI
jgi:hypothetical protein